MTKFAEALKPHREAKRLEGAVRRTASEIGHTLHQGFKGDRATISRWLSGTLPRHREIVVHLAGILKDQGLLDAYDEDMLVKKIPGDVQNIFTRWSRLPLPQRAATLGELTREWHRESPSTRARMGMEIDLHKDSPGCHRLDVDITWSGILPANATVRIAPDEDELSEAFQLPDCVFRELIPMAPDDFDAAYSDLGSHLPALKFRGARGDKWIEMQARPAEDKAFGRYAFDNGRVDQAQINLSVRFPYPANVSFYGVVFGGYAVRGTTRVTMNMNDTNAQPHAVPFLLSSEDYEIHHRTPDRAVVTVELGDEETVLAPGAGVAFYWREIG